MRFTPVVAALPWSLEPHVGNHVSLGAIQLSELEIMSAQQPPSLIRLDMAKAPFERACSRIESIREKVGQYETDSVELQGLFALGIAGVESALPDAHLYMLRTNPSAFNFDKLEITRNDALGVAPVGRLLEKKMAQKVRSDMYGTLHQQLKRYCASAGFSELDPSGEVELLMEAKETRNLLMHSSLRANDDYLSKAGARSRAKRTGESLAITPLYADQALQAAAGVMTKLAAELDEKYAGCTKEDLLRRVWAYLFSSPVMPFDDYWEVAAGGSRIYMSTGKFEGGLAKSEKMFLSVWRYHFNQWTGEGFQPISMRSLDPENQLKMLWFLSAIPELPVG